MSELGFLDAGFAHGLATSLYMGDYFFKVEQVKKHEYLYELL
jgi:hypothetical protein